MSRCSTPRIRNVRTTTERAGGTIDQANPRTEFLYRTFSSRATSMRRRYRKRQSSRRSSAIRVDTGLVFRGVTVGVDIVGARRLQQRQKRRLWNKDLALAGDSIRLESALPNVGANA